MRHLVTAALPLLSFSLAAQGTPEAPEPNNTTSTAAALATGSQAYGDLDVSGTDEDWFQFTLTAPADVRIWTGPGFALPVDDTMLSLRNSTGAEIIGIDDGNDLTHHYYSILTVPTLAAGTYFVSVLGFDTAAIGSYTLDLVAMPTGTYSPPLAWLPEGAEVNDPRLAGGVATPIALNSRVHNGNIVAPAGGGTAWTATYSGTNDYDLYAVTLPAGPVRIETHQGAGIDSGDTVVHLLDASFARIAFNDDGGWAAYSLLNSTIATAGNYFIAVNGYGATHFGSYVLDVITPGTTPTGASTVTMHAGGCAGSAGTPTLGTRANPLSALVTRKPEELVLGSTFVLDGRNLPASAPLFRLIGTATLSPFFDLGAFGATGCFVEVNPVANDLAFATAGGVDWWPLATPPAPWFVGFTIEQQLAVIDPLAAGGITVSNRVTSVAGVSH